MSIQWPTNNRTSKYVAACQIIFKKGKYDHVGQGKWSFHDIFPSSE